MKKKALRDESQAYDLIRPKLMSKDNERLLRVTHELFCDGFGVYLSSKLRTIARLDIRSIEQMPYEEYAVTVPNPCHLYVFRISDVERNGIFDFQAELFLFCIDKLFGGTGRIPENGTKGSHSMIGRELMRNMAEEGLRHLGSAWGRVWQRNGAPVAMSLGRLETNAEFVPGICPPGEIMIVVTCGVAIQNASFVLRLCFPEFLTRHLFAQRQVQTQDPVSVIEEGLKATRVPLVVRLGTVYIPVEELLNLQVGDIVPLDTRVGQPVEVLVEGVRKFLGQVGVLYNRKSVRIIAPSASGGESS